MPIIDLGDATNVERQIDRVFEARSLPHRAVAIRRLFVDILDFDTDSGYVSLVNAPNNVSLPDSAERIAWRDGVHILYVALDTEGTDRVRKGEVSAAAKLIEDQLGDDMLLVFTNTSATQLHFIYPSFDTAQPILRRMLVERDLPRRTAVQQVSNIYWNYEDSDSISAALDEAFDVEPVTKKFFAKYKRIFESAKQSVTGFGYDEDTKHLFVQTLFNRLMFIYFLQRKGWLRFEGNNDYLNALWRDYHQPASTETNFYTSRLAPLFFAGLNNPQSQNLSRNNPYLHGLIGDVPFLNGGLFEQTDLDKRDGIVVPDGVIESILDDLFDKFNFAVMESTPFDIEVAVDPEMLGKVFEELVTGRHASGSYYTPRPVVSFMCREALKGYLEGKDTGLNVDAIARFVDQRDPSGIDLVAARRISEALADVKVVDPACGSGAYLLGMMQELIELQTTLYNVGVDAKALYELKLEIIQRNLYGVDIDDFAVNIAMLRMWLSLSIEYEGAKPDPLPNLDFKVLCGDSLLGPDPSAGVEVQGILGRDADRIGRLGKLKADYMRAYLGPEKERLRRDIQEMEAGIREALGNVGVVEGVIDWRVEFAEVFAQRRGFDIAIANPPYGIFIDDRHSADTGNSDSYVNFMSLVSEIAPHGVMAYITPTSWETGERFRKFRQFLFSKMALQTVVNLPYDVFDTPYVDTAIIIGTMGKAHSKIFRLATLEKRAQLDLTQIANYLSLLEWSVVTGDASFRLPMLGWAGSLFSRLAASATPLGQIASSKRGIEAYKFDILNNPSQDTLEFFDGQVQRYEISASSALNFVVVSNREIPFHRGPRILTRRIVSRANRLLSARSKTEFVVKKDIYSIKPNFDDPKKLAVLLAILNSSLLSFLYLSRSAAATKDDFRQVTLAGLRELPINFPTSSAQVEELARLVLAREQQTGQATDLEQQIDEIIYRIYGIAEDEQEAIAAWLARSG